MEPGKELVASVFPSQQNMKPLGTRVPGYSSVSVCVEFAGYPGSTFRSQSPDTRVPGYQQENCSNCMSSVVFRDMTAFDPRVPETRPHNPTPNWYPSTLRIPTRILKPEFTDVPPERYSGRRDLERFQALVLKLVRQRLPYLHHPQPV